MKYEQFWTYTFHFDRLHELGLGSLSGRIIIKIESEDLEGEVCEGKMSVQA